VKAEQVLRFRLARLGLAHRTMEFLRAAAAPAPDFSRDAALRAEDFELDCSR